MFKVGFPVSINLNKPPQTQLCSGGDSRSCHIGDTNHYKKDEQTSKQDQTPPTE